MRKYSILAITLGIIPVILIFLIVSQVSATTKKDEPGFGKIERLVLDQINTQDSADFFVWMRGESDLQPAYHLDTKFERGRYVFQTLNATAFHSQASLRGYLDRNNIGYHAYFIVNAILIRDGEEDLLFDIASRDDVESITANHEYELQLPSVSKDISPGVTSVEPNLVFINADDVWAMGYTGQGIVLANNDTGVDETHSALAAHYRGCLDPPTCSIWDHNYNWWDATDTYPLDPNDGHNHGTFTSGIMVGYDGGGNQIGVAPGSKTIHCKVLTDGGGYSDDSILECLQWDLAPWDLNNSNPDPGLAPDVVNIPWGIYGGGQMQFKLAIQALQAAGIAVVASAGSDGPACNTLRSPGDFGELMTVGYIDQSSGLLPGVIKQFVTSRGPSSIDPGYFPGVMGPGENIRSSINNPSQGYSIWSGTSLASTHVTGILGLCWSANPSLRRDLDLTFQLIHVGAVPLTGQFGSNCGGDYVTGPNNDWGYGTIDALAIVQACIDVGGLGYLDGHVVSEYTIDPIVGVSITAVDAGGDEWGELTDEFGYYTMTLPTGIFTVTVDHPRYSSVITSGVQVISGVVTTVDFQLTPLGRLFGYVTDEVEGFPLLATISVGEIITITNPSNGYYQLYLDGGDYYVNAGAQGYVTETLGISISYGEDTIQNFALLPVPEFYTPTASFLASTPSCLSETTSFSNTSEVGNPPADEFNWDFGDGITLSLETTDTVAHVYQAASDYPVTLEACNEVGCDSKGDVLKVFSIPNADFAYISHSLLVTFTNISTQTESFIWDFGDGTTSTLTNTTHLYSIPGEYPVSLTAINQCDADIKIQWVNLNYEADLSISKIDLVDPIHVGENIVYVISVLNNGPDSASNVILSDTLPPEVSLISASVKCTQESGTLDCDLGDVPMDGEVTIVLLVRGPDLSGKVTNVAGVHSDDFDPDVSNNSAIEETSILAEEGLIFLPLMINQ
jgi:uncharacterized repeat protein (TIGR01451 family)